MKTSAAILFNFVLSVILSPAFATVNCLCHDKRGENRVIIENYEGKNCADLVTDANVTITLDSPVAGSLTCSQKDIGKNVSCAYSLERVHMASCSPVTEGTEGV